MTGTGRVGLALALMAILAPALPSAPASAAPGATDPAMVAASSIVAEIPIGKGTFGGVLLTVDGRKAFTLGSKTVRVADLATRKQLRPVPVGYTFDYAVSKNGVLVYAARDNDSVDIIEAKSGKRRHRTPLDCTPYYLAITPDSKHIYAACSEYGDINEINASTGAIEKGGFVIGEASSLAISPDGSRIFGTSVAEDNLQVVDFKVDDFIARVDVCVGSYASKSNRDASRIYVLCSQDGTPGSDVWAVDVASKKVVAKAHVDNHATDFAVSPDGRALYVAATDLLTLDAASLATIGSVSLGGRTVKSIAVTPDGTQVVALAQTTATKQNSILALTAPAIPAA